MRNTTKRSEINRVYTPRLNDRNRKLSPQKARAAFTFYFSTGAGTVRLPPEESAIEAGHLVAYLDRLGVEPCRKGGVA